MVVEVVEVTVVIVVMDCLGVVVLWCCCGLVHFTPARLRNNWWGLWLVL